MNLTYDDYAVYRGMVLTAIDNHEHILQKRYKQMFLFWNVSSFCRNLAKRELHFKFFKRHLKHGLVEQKADTAVSGEIVQLCHDSTSDSENKRKYDIKGRIESFRGRVIEFYEHKGAGYKGECKVITGFVGSLQKRLNIIYRGYSFWGIKKLFIKKMIREKLITIDDSKKVNIKIIPKDSNPTVNRLRLLGLYQEKEKYRFFKHIIRG
jgi:hypothetical protein